MAKRNFNNSFGHQRHRGQQHNNFHVNRFQYNGPYPQHEISAARQLLSYQFLNNSGRAMRSLRMKMQHTINFFHEAQIETVISSSFAAVQEEGCLSSDLNPADGNHSVSEIQRTVDIHTIANKELDEKNENLKIEVSIKEKYETSVESSTSTNSTGEPPKKKQKLINKPGNNNLLDNNHSSYVDSNGNIESISVSSDELLNDTRKSMNDSDPNIITINDTSNEVVISSEEEEEEGELAEEEDKVSDKSDLCLMCDLCLHVVKGCTKDSEERMKNHFLNAKHNAASLVEAKIDGDKLIPRFVLEKHCLSNNSVDTNILPVCPECNMIQGSIWTCAMHYQQSHDTNSPNVYGLGKVVNRCIVQVSSRHVCQTCQMEFPNANKLHKHWKSHKHYPFKEPHSSQIMQFICKDCGKKEQSFLMQRGHILSAHATKINNAITDMQILYLEKTSKLCLLPDTPKSVEDQVIEGKRLFNKGAKSTKLTKNQRRRMKKTTLPSKVAMKEFKNGATYNVDKERYEKFLDRHIHYNRYHFSQTCQKT